MSLGLKENKYLEGKRKGHITPGSSGGGGEDAESRAGNTKPSLPECITSLLTFSCKQIQAKNEQP